MADQENRIEGQQPDQKKQEDTSVLGQQAGGEGGQANFTQASAGASFSGDVSGQTNPYAQGPEATGTSQIGAQGQGGEWQGQHQAGNLNTQGEGATSDQLGQNNQSYGASTQQDTTFGQGPGQAIQGAQGQSGVLGQRPGQGGGQPSSTATGGPDLSQGLKSQNNQGGSGA